MKLIVSEFLTLDGVMEAPGGEQTHPHSGWAGDFMNPEWLRYKLDEVLEAEAHLLGRVTYESFAGAWPQREGEFADRVNGMPKYVVSTTLEELAWTNCTLIDGDVIERIQELRQRQGGPLLVAGSRTLVQTLMAHDLVDELRLMVFPVVLGSGLRLFPESADETVYKHTGVTDPRRECRCQYVRARVASSIAISLPFCGSRCIQEPRGFADARGQRRR